MAVLKTNRSNHNLWLFLYKSKNKNNVLSKKSFSQQQQKRKLETKVEREKKILGQLPEPSLQIYELAREHGQIKVEEIIRATGAARGTIKDHPGFLIKNGYLIQHGKGKGTWYSAS